MDVAVDECRRRYYGWARYHPREAEMPAAAWAAGWAAGGRSALVRSSQFIELVPRLIELIELLHEEDTDEPELDLEALYADDEP